MLLKNSIDRAVSVALAAAALVVAITFAHREFAAQPVQATPIAAPKFIPNWQSLLSSGEVIGDRSAPIKVIEFGDFECPFCRAADTVFRALTREHPSRVALVFVHFPLTIHRFAMPAAIAAECAARQHRFSQFHDLLYTKQDSLGLKSWNSYAAEAGVVDTSQFQQCVQQPGTVATISAGIAAGRQFNVEGTPTVFLNGWRFSRPPTLAELDSVVQSLGLGAR